VSPWALLGGVLIWAGSLAATGAWFYESGQDSELASQAKIDRARQETRAIAAQAAASAIADIKVEHRTIQGRVERVTVEKPVYRDCRHDADSVRDINQALTGRRPEPSGGGELPRADGVGR